MKSDRQRWDQRFSDKPLTAPKPPGFLVQEREVLPSGRALDIASGDGAAALWLAAQGFDTTAVDISSVALSRLQSFAQQQQLSITELCCDLDDPAQVTSQLAGSFDVIVMAHFKPSLALMTQLGSLLSPTGQLLLTTFNQQHHLSNGFSQRFCLAPSEFESSVPGLRCLHYQSVMRGDSYMDDYRWSRESI